MLVAFKPAPPELTAEYIRLRGATRENSISEEQLRELGITAESWAQQIQSERIRGVVALSDEQLAGYCFGDFASGEIVVLAVRPAFEGQGIGQRLLAMVVDLLHAGGHTRMFLSCAPDPCVRSHGFYRHLGWRSTGTFDDRGDEVLELLRP